MDLFRSSGQIVSEYLSKSKYYIKGAIDLLPLLLGIGCHVIVIWRDRTMAGPRCLWTK